MQKVEAVMYFRRENLSHLYFLCGSLVLVRGGGATQPCGAAAAGLTPKLALMAAQAEVSVSVRWSSPASLCTRRTTLRRKLETAERRG